MIILSVLLLSSCDNNNGPIASYNFIIPEPETIVGNRGSHDFWIIKLSESGTIQWKKCYGGTDSENAESIQQTTDGGYIISGHTSSNDIDVSGHKGETDFWIVKIDSEGKIQWQKALGGYYFEHRASSIQQTADGGYIVAGITHSNDGDVTGNHGEWDGWIIKLDAEGNVLWKKCIGGSRDDKAISIQQITDSGYIIAGDTYSNDGDVTGNHGDIDAWVCKLDESGSIVWLKCFGGTESEKANSIQQTTDGGYVVAGVASSDDGDVSGVTGHTDYWIVKIDNIGNIEWQKCLGSTWDDRAKSIYQTFDGGFIVVGDVMSDGDNITGYHDKLDAWIVKLDESGNLQWEKCLGGSGLDFANSVQQTTDGGFIIAGETNSNDGDLSGINKGMSDYWIIKLDTSGNIIWQKSLGGSGNDIARSIVQTTDGGYIVAGGSGSDDGDIM